MYNNHKIYRLLLQGLSDKIALVRYILSEVQKKFHRSNSAYPELDMLKLQLFKLPYILQAQNTTLMRGQKSLEGG